MEGELDRKTTKKSLPVKAIAPRRFDITNEDEKKDMLAYLDTHGYAVIASVASASQIKQAKDNFWDFSEHLCPELKRFIHTFTSL